jgi:prephenate dehydratase
MRETHPEFTGDTRYFSNVEAVWEGLLAGSVSGVVLGGDTQHTGFVDEHVQRLVAGGICVLDEVVLSYGCCLLVKHGTTLDDVKVVLGHGSLRQCTGWLDHNLPGAERVVHPGSSVMAAAEVARADGTLAVVGSVVTADSTGLEVLARGIDDGATAAWWLFGTTLAKTEAYTTCIVAGTFDGSGNLGRLVSTFVEEGWKLRSTCVKPTTRALFEVDVVAVFIGEPASSTLTTPEAMAATESARVVGAF